MSKLQSKVESVCQLAEEIISGRRMRRTDDLSILLTADIEELCSGADAIRKAFCGNKVDLCTIVNGRSGRCSEDCKFCDYRRYVDYNGYEHS